MPVQSHQLFLLVGSVGVLGPTVKEQSADAFSLTDFEVITNGRRVGVVRSEEKGLLGEVEEVRYCVLVVIHAIMIGYKW